MFMKVYIVLIHTHSIYLLDSGTYYVQVRSSNDVLGNMPSERWRRQKSNCKRKENFNQTYRGLYRVRNSKTDFKCQGLDDK